MLENEVNGFVALLRCKIDGNHVKVTPYVQKGPTGQIQGVGLTRENRFHLMFFSFSDLEEFMESRAFVQMTAPDQPTVFDREPDDPTRPDARYGQ